jgi:hypothetical protein
MISTVAGSGAHGFSYDGGPGTRAQLATRTGTVDADGAGWMRVEASPEPATGQSAEHRARGRTGTLVA